MVIAKFTVTRNDPVDSPDGGNVVVMIPVIAGSAENENFFMLTPAGEIRLQIVNPNTAKFFEVGKEMYAIFEKPEEKQIEAGDTESNTAGETKE